VNPADLSKQIDEENIKVTMDDFISALSEVKPAFGAAINTLEMCRFIFPDCFQTNCFQTGFVSNTSKYFIAYGTLLCLGMSCKDCSTVP
jgi:hypothetical protein